jgi:vacuolar-type H+-ATPase subunit H
VNSQTKSIIKENTESAEKAIEKKHIEILMQAKKEIETLLSKQLLKQSPAAKKKKFI